jgi:predicted transcriptional regulator
MKKQIRIGIGDATLTAKRFIDVWKQAERGEKVRVEHSLNFESLETLLKTLTSARWVLLKVIRKSGPMSIRSLAKTIGRDYKNVHTDVKKMEAIGLIDRTKDDKIKVPWDIVEARLRLAA